MYQNLESERHRSVDAFEKCGIACNKSTQIYHEEMHKNITKQETRPNDTALNAIRESFKNEAFKKVCLFEIA